MNIEDIKAMYRHDLANFAKFSFHELHPYVEYQSNWHLKALAEVLYKVERGEIKRLIINMPPRMLKSHFTSIALPAWILGRAPHKKILCLHGSKDLGEELHEASWQLMSNPRYRALFEHIVIKPQKKRLMTTFGGGRQYMSINGNLTGLGADFIIIDDPIGAVDAQKAHRRKSLNDQFDYNILPRLNNKKDGVIIVVMQRLSEHDLTGHLLAKSSDWVHFSIPAIALTDEVWDLPHGKKYLRQKGEVLHAARADKDQLKALLHAIGGTNFNYQYLQRQYQPRLANQDESYTYVTPMREGVFWDVRKDSGFSGLLKLKEEDFILPHVFGIGQDPYPSGMRLAMTMDEFMIAMKELPKYQAKMQNEYETQTGAYAFMKDRVGQGTRSTY